MGNLHNLQLSRLDCSVSFLLLVLPRDSSAPRRNAVGSLVLVEREGRERPREGGREGNWSVAAAAEEEEEEERATGGGRQS